MVVTIFYLSLVLPLLLTSIEVDACLIAMSLIALMLLPLILGLLISRSRRPRRSAGSRAGQQTGRGRSRGCVTGRNGSTGDALGDRQPIVE